MSRRLSSTSMRMRTKQRFTQRIRCGYGTKVPRKMDKLHKEFPDIIRLKSWTEVSKTYVLPKKLVRIGKPKVLSEAQLRHLKELQSKA